ncbi:MAG: MFS transporter [Veillonella magna]|nr:MFS transporter [Veillonella magna]
MRKERGYLHLSKENTVLLTVMVASFLTPFTGSALNMSLPDIGKEFSAGTSAMSWIVEIFLITCTIFVLPMGRLSNIVGKRRIFLGGTALFTFSSVVIHLVQSVEMLLLVRALQGIASAMLFATNMAIIALAYPKEKRGKAMGLAVSVIYIGLAVGPVVGGFLNYYFGWRSIFYFITINGAAAMALTLKVMREEWISEPNGRMDYISSVLYGITLVLLMYGWSEIVTDPMAKYMLMAGLVLAVIFVRYQATKKDPLLPVRIFLENRTFSFSNLAAMMNYSATFAIAFLLSLYLQMIMGYDSNHAGMILLIQSIIMAVLSPVAGSLSDRYGSKVLASAGMAVIGAGLLVMIYATHVEALTMIIAALLIVGVGFAMFSAPNNNAIMSAVPKQYFGLASSVIGTVRLTGQVLSMAIVASILSRPVVGLVDSTAMLLYNIQHAFMVFAVICFLGIIPSWIRE